MKSVVKKVLQDAKGIKGALPGRVTSRYIRIIVAVLGRVVTGQDDCWLTSTRASNAFLIHPIWASVEHFKPKHIIFFILNILFNVFESLVSSLRSGAALRVEKSNFAALLRLTQELLSSLLGMINPESLSVEEAIRLLRIGTGLGAAFCDQFGSLRDFIASRFTNSRKKFLTILTSKQPKLFFRILP